jgi:predicted RNase H-like nuclease (RuvC/YqgF family)
MRKQVKSQPKRRQLETELLGVIMKRQTVLAGLTMVAVLTLVSACQQDPQMIKRAQLAGYENRQLKKQIEQKDAEIAALKQQHAMAQQQKDAEIAALKQQIEQALQKIQNIQKQLDETTNLAKQADAENLRLKDQSLQRDAEITNLKQQVNTMSEDNMRSQQMIFITQLTELLAQCQQKLAKYEPVVDANVPAEPNQ